MTGGKAVPNEKKSLSQVNETKINRKSDFERECSGRLENVQDMTFSFPFFASPFFAINDNATNVLTIQNAAINVR